ncbi:uncharacterized protein N7511_011502 [Penicillium nucicola]|uniref:uncharacterized protein n=1 Tax=Penicillium nucicola TaxID=1850975 RepID=UPI002544FD34|nr:uncharacterized protein N7511_011502 [Penicillium nucicola]KAJ5742483.1 hypothetical protein N7511_011502 [Penicillium nucicola]
MCNQWAKRGGIFNRVQTLDGILNTWKAGGSLGPKAKNKQGQSSRQLNYIHRLILHQSRATIALYILVSEYSTLLNEEPILRHTKVSKYAVKSPGVQ